MSEDDVVTYRDWSVYGDPCADYFSFESCFFSKKAFPDKKTALTELRDRFKELTKEVEVEIAKLDER